MEHCYPSAVEYRFPGPTGVLIANNLSNKPVRARDGATARLAANITTATADWFVASAAGDLHLSDEARAVDRGVAIPDLVEDFDDEARPRGSSVDVGADEWYSP